MTPSLAEIERLRRALLERVDLADVRCVDRAIDAVKAGNLNEALRCLTEAIEGIPDSADAIPEF